MERLTIDEVIEHCKRKVKNFEKVFQKEHFERKKEECFVNNITYNEYWEHRQVAEWLEKLKEYEQAEEDGLLMLKVWILESSCYKPNDCDGDCAFCDGDELDTKEILIKYSDFDKTKHYKSEAEAEQALAKMKGEA